MVSSGSSGDHSLGGKKGFGFLFNKLLEVKKWFINQSQNFK